MRGTPLGAPNASGGTKVEGLDDIRNELKGGLDNYIKEFVVTQNKNAEDFENEIILQMYRKNNAILKEFGW